MCGRGQCGGYPGPVPALTYTKASQPVALSLPPRHTLCHPRAPTIAVTRAAGRGGCPHPGCRARWAEGQGLGVAHSPQPRNSARSPPKDSVGGVRPARPARRGSWAPQSPSRSKRGSPGQSHRASQSLLRRRDQVSPTSRLRVATGAQRSASPTRSGGRRKRPPAGRRKCRPPAFGPMERPFPSLRKLSPPMAFWVLWFPESTEVDRASPIPTDNTPTRREGEGKGRVLVPEISNNIQDVIYSCCRASRA